MSHATEVNLDQVEKLARYGVWALQNGCNFVGQFFRAIHRILTENEAVYRSFFGIEKY
jgi:hypothetical protein